MPDASAALIDQLVYIDNFINSGSGDTPNLDVDGQLLLDLAAFADDLFIFPDEDKPSRPDDDIDDQDGHGNHQNHEKHLHELSGVDGFNSNWFEHHDDLNSGPDITNRKLEGSKALAKINESTKLAKLNRTNLYGNHVPAISEQPEKNADSAHKPEIPDLLNLPKFPVPPGAKSSLQQAGLSQNQIDLLSALIAQHQSSLGNVIPNASEGLTAETPQSLPFAIAPTLASNGHVNSLILTEQDVVSSSVAASRSSHQNSHLVDSPGSMYSSGYSSGGNSMLLTPQVGSRGSVSMGSSGSTDVDKRKRNTAASARFRIKKKLKEKEMETKIDQLDEMIKNFELKINELEMENRLLKNLIIEKGNRNSDQELKLLKERVRHQK